MDIQKFREEFAAEIWKRIAEGSALRGADSKSLKEVVEERLNFLNKLSISTDPLVRLAFLCETQTYDEAIVRAVNFNVGKNHAPKDVYKAFSEIYPSLRDKILKGIK